MSEKQHLLSSKQMARFVADGYDTAQIAHRARDHG